ncbi:multicopper oxidase family protein [Lysobacter terrae]
MEDRVRRRLLLGLSATTVAAAVPWLWWRQGHRGSHGHAESARAVPASAQATMTPFQQPLRLPGEDGLLAEVSLSGPLQLQARISEFPVFPGARTRVWHYAGTHDGRSVANPLLRAARGDDVEVTVANALDEDTTLHWHGLHVDEANDGSGLHPIAPGAHHDYRFRIDNRAGMYWYHAHPHGRTGLQLQHGLAGLLLIEDEEERRLRDRLGLKWGERDLPLLIGDKQVDSHNEIVYRVGADDWIGNRMLVNWTPEPTLETLPALYRLRLANVCNARLLRLAFIHEGQSLPFQLIGTDGGLLAQPWTIEDLFLAPAQRADVLVDFSRVPAGARVVLRSLDYVPMEDEDESGAFLPDPMRDHPGAAPMGAPLDVMQFCIAGCDGNASSSPAPPPRIPTALSDLPPPPDTADWPVRALRLRMDEAGAWYINDWNFHRDGHAPAFSVKRGSREVWEIRNSMTSMPHPIHLHGFQFRTVSRSISPHDVRSRQVAPNGLGPQDLGCNDTVLVWPGEIVRIALDFSQPFHGTQRYMLHCHNLEHEDMGMMLTFAVTD